MSNPLLQEYADYVNPMKVRTLHSAGLDVVEARREGARVWDTSGKEYVDCISAAGSFNVGRRNPKIIRALEEALETTDLGVFLLGSPQKGALARRLAEITPGDLRYTMYGSGGGEAVDFAIKLARGYTRRPGVVSMDRAYHGHTGFALAAIGREVYQEPFRPLAPGFATIPFNDLAAAEAAITEETAAVILEPVQGEGGIHVASDAFMNGLRRLCDERGALLVFDEIQTGFGRTGRLFAAEHYGVVPDVMTLAKSLGGGLYPISATVFREPLGDFLFAHPFIHLSTFGGSDLGCAVGLATIDYIVENDLPGHAAKMGERFAAGFEELRARHGDLLVDVRRKGLMMGLQFNDESMGPRMSFQLARFGVLAIYTGNEPSVMRIMPPLVIGPEEVDRVLEALDRALSAIESGDTGVADEAPRRSRRRPGR